MDSTWSFLIIINIKNYFIINRLPINLREKASTTANCSNFSN